MQLQKKIKFMDLNIFSKENTKQIYHWEKQSIKWYNDLRQYSRYYSYLTREQNPGISLLRESRVSCDCTFSEAAQARTQQSSKLSFDRVNLTILQAGYRKGTSFSSLYAF